MENIGSSEHLYGRLLPKMDLSSFLTTEYEEYLKMFGEDHGGQHPASLIFHEWQKDFTRGWKWDGLHRHTTASSTSPVPIHDCNLCVPPLQRRITLTQYFKGGPDAQTHRVWKKPMQRLLQSRRRRKNARFCRRFRKLQWWNRNVVERIPGDYFRQYNEYRSRFHGLGIDPLTKLYKEQGITFRHIRMSGYIPYVQLSVGLHDEYRAKNTRANEIFRVRQAAEIIDLTLD